MTTVAIDRPRLIDARKLRDKGIGRYLEGLLPALLNADDTHRYILIVRRVADVDRLGMPPRVLSRIRVIVEPAADYSLREAAWLPMRAAMQRPQLLHSPHLATPVVFPFPVVVTVQDLIHLRFPQYQNHRGAKLFFGVMAHAIRAAARVIVPSDSTRRDVEKIFKVPTERVAVIPYASSPIFIPADHRSIDGLALKSLGVRGVYVLYVGACRPHKNLGVLIRALRVMIEEGWRGCLVLAGCVGPARNAIEQLAIELGVSDSMIWIDTPSDADLLELYRGAIALVHPALLEGFGFGPLEAMACGTPVVASNTGSIPEVVGDAGVLVTPTVEGLIAGMRSVVADEALRRRLRNAGIARASKFSWDRAARQHLHVYERASSKPPRSTS